SKLHIINTAITNAVEANVDRLCGGGGLAGRIAPGQLNGKAQLLDVVAVIRFTRVIMRGIGGGAGAAVAKLPGEGCRPLGQVGELDTGFTLARLSRHSLKINSQAWAVGVQLKLDCDLSSGGIRLCAADCGEAD